MGILQKLTIVGKKLFGGGQRKKKKLTATLQPRRYTSKPIVGKEFHFGNRQVYNDLREKHGQPREENALEKAFKADPIKSTTKSTKSEPPSAKSSGATEAQKKARETYYKGVKQNEKDAAKARLKKKQRAKEEHEEFHKLTNHKYDVGYWESKGNKEKAAEAKQRIKSGESASDPVGEKMAVKYHPKTYSATRGALSGVTFGMSDLAMAKLLKGEQKEANEYYQKHKSKGWETAGEIAGSLVSFGGASKGAAKAVGKGLETTAGRKAVAKLAERKFVQKSARKALEKGVKKGALSAGEALGEEALKEAAKSKSKKLLATIGEDALINATVGGAYDFNKATAQNKIGSKEWKKEMRDAALFNLAIGGVATVGANRLGAKGAAEEAAETVAKRKAARKALNSLDLADSKAARNRAVSLADDIAKIRNERMGDARNVLADNAPDIMQRGGYGSKRSLGVSELDDAVKSKYRRTTELGGIDVRKPKKLTDIEKRNLEGLRASIEKDIAKIEGEALGKTDESKRLRRQVKKINTVLKNADDNVVAKEAENAEKLVTLEELINQQSADAADNAVGNEVKKVADEVTEEVPKRKPTKDELQRDELRREREALQAEYEAAKKEGGDVDGILADMQETDGRLQDLDRKIAKADKSREAQEVKTKAKPDQGTASAAGQEGKATPPKTAEQKKQDEIAERQMFDAVQRKREAKMADSMREQTGGEYSYRQGEHTATAHANIDEARRIEEEQKSVYQKLKDGNVKELFTDENTPFGVFKTANKAELKKKAGEAATRVRNDTYGTVHRLMDKAERLRAELTSNSALSSAEHVTLDDIADITAIRNMFDDAGVVVPKEYEEAFSHIIEWQRTEAAQMLKSVDLFLKENDKAYRRMFIARDMDKYLRKVLHSDDAAIADIKRSLEENYGAGYYEKMLDELAKFRGSKDEAAFRKAYADFQAQVFMNTRPTVWDTVNLWRHAFMLSSPKTGANNIIGNINQRVMYRISDAMNMAGESIAKGVNPDVRRTTALLKSDDQRRLARMYTSGRRGEHNIKNAKYLDGFKDQEFADAINRMSDTDVGDMMASSKYMGDVIKGLQYKPTTTAGKVKQGFIKGGRFGNEYVSLMLNEPDSWFVERNYRTALLKYLEANGVNSSTSMVGKEELLQEARAYAKDVALENTYKKANNVVSFLEGIRAKGHTKGSNAGYKAAAIMLDAEMPYLKVPANLIVNNFKYSPLGLGKGAVDAFRGAIKGDADMLNRATRELSKGLTGTGMMALGYMMFCRDQTDSDSWGFIGNAKDELKEYGVRDNSFKIGNKNFNIANMGIGSVQFLMGASLAEDLAEKGEIPSHQVVLDAISKIVDTEADMSLMENAVTLLDAFGNGGDYDATVSDRLGNAGMKIAGDYAAQFVPNPLRGVAKGMTSADLDTGVRKGDTTGVQRALERNKNNFIQGVPVVNEKVLPHKVDSHGNLVNERRTGADKTKAIANNMLNPLSPREVNIPEADKEELKVKKENGEAFKPNGFDKDRKYKAKVGSGRYAEEVELTGKEREQVARSAKNSGYDMADALVRKGMFGDRLGARAQGILNKVPADGDEEKTREMIFSTPEWKNADNATKEKWLEVMYGQGSGNQNKGVSRTRNEEAYVNNAGNSEGDFRFQNDLNWQNQKKYYDKGLSEAGIDKGTWADIVSAVYDASHKWDEENGKNVDTPNSAKKVKAAILSIEGLTPEQRVAVYQAYRGKRNGFGWYDWDGVSSGYSGYRRRGYRRYRRRGGGGGGSSKIPALKQSAFKATNSTYKTAATKLPRSSRPSTSTTAPVKIEPPKVKFKKYEV